MSGGQIHLTSCICRKHQDGHGNGSGIVSENGDGIGIAGEGLDLGADPPQRLDLVSDPEVAGDVNVIRSQKACPCRRSQRKD